MEVQDLTNLIAQGGAPIGATILFFLWKLDKQMTRVLSAHETLIDILVQSGINVPPSKNKQP